GRAFVYYGSESGLSTNADWIAESNQNNTSFSTSVSSAGDVNADGYSDVIIGAPYYTNGQDVEGRVFVYYGSASGLSTNADWTSESNQDYAWFGFSVSTAGDVNGDGYSDVIIGACQYDNSQIDEGRVFVYYGSASGLSTNADWTSESNQDGAYYGLRVSTAGDVNGDGYSDVIIGAPYYSNGNSAEGSAFVYYGSDLGFSTNADWTAEINQDNAYFGYSVSTAGDVNADGYSDVIVGAYKYDNPETDEGRVFVYQGSSSGLTTEYWASESNQNNASYGNSVSRAGDVNGDGYSDIIIGADQYDNGQTNEGRTLVFYGNEGGLSLRPIQMNPKNSIIYIGDKISEKIIISMFGRTIIGRNQVRLQVEIKELTEEFNGTELLESAWDETGGTLGAKTLRCNYVPPTDNLYKWRARLEYPLSKSNIKFSRWIFYDQPNELDFHTLGSNIPLYLNLKIFLQGAYR
ncbi:MAG: FG-GAP repeat protein, partial [Ignavibacteriales bacterium]|nr:FG-GAP repeat protein [Ignavibacteriales bacterium]